MAKRKEKAGTGITAYTVVVADGEDIGPTLERNLAQWTDEVKRCGGYFAAASEHMVQEAHLVLAEADDGPYQTDSLEDYAERIVTYHRCASAELGKGNHDRAMWYALKLGCLYISASMKENWEPDALRGRQARERLAANSREQNARVQKEALRRESEWQQRADEVWEKRPDLKKSAVADIVLKKIELAIKEDEAKNPNRTSDIRKLIAEHGTVRKKIKKPTK